MTGISLKRLKCDVGIVGSGPVGLVLSTLLSRYGVQHVILDRKLQAAEHPQAHFLHARTMEIIQSYMGDANKSIINALPPSDYWRCVIRQCNCPLLCCMKLNFTFLYAILQRFLL